MYNKKNYIYYLLIISFLGILCLRASYAGTAEEQYYKTEVLYRKFLEDIQKTKYRENWLYYIEEFRKAYSLDPSGSLSAAALYMSGELYWELYKRSFKSSDKKEAADAFERVAKHFPQSIYKRKADEALQILAGTKKDAASPSVTPRKDEDKKETPQTAPAPVTDAVEKASPKSSSPIKNIVRRELFRNSKEAYKASLSAKSEPDYKVAAVKKPENIPPLAVTATSITTSNASANITGLRYWSNPSYTRIVVDADRDTAYNYNMIKKDGANKSHRLCIDFKNSHLGKNVQNFIPINDDLLTGARASNYEAGMVRLVIDIKSFKTYKIFSLKNPFRIIIDVWGDVPAQTTTQVASRPNPATSRIQTKSPQFSKPEFPSPVEIPKRADPKLTTQLALGIRRIVIDPGHGGHDGGAPGYYKGVYEKDVVLSIGKLLAAKVRRDLGCEAILTRSTDRFLTLEERTAIANTKNADLFVSIHTNAHTDHSAYGIETYFLNLATDDDSIRVAARENATTRKNISDLQKILSDLMRNSKINESSRLAAQVQRSMYSQINSAYGRVKNKGVKQAPFYVLLGAQMPSILIETSFISNKRECERLTDPTYQNQLCDAIVKGIRKYIEATNPTALLRLRGRG